MKWLLATVMGLVVSLREGEAFLNGGAIVAARTGRISVGSTSCARRRAEATGGLRMADVVVEFMGTGKTVTAVVGSPLSQLCAKNGIKVKYSCKQGDCATCSINIDGRYVKACQGRVPASRRIVKIKA